MKFGGLKEEKSLMIDFGGFTASDYILITTSLGKPINLWLDEAGFIKITDTCNAMAAVQLSTDCKKRTHNTTEN